MATVDARIEIGRPVEEVYSYVTDLRNDPQWWAGVSRCVRLAGEGGVGTRYQLEARLLGMTVPTQIDVTHAEPPHSMTIVADGRLPYTARYGFSPTGKGTRLAISVDIERAPWRQLGPVLALVMRHYLRDLNRILTR